VYGIAPEDDAGTVRTFKEALGLTFPILMDEGGVVHRDYAMTTAFMTTAFPQDWVVGTDGRIVYANNAFEPDEMRIVIERELE
jgi:peroxiredoxin